MFEDRPDIVERVVSYLKRPVRIDAALDRRVMEEIASVAPPRERGVDDSGPSHAGAVPLRLSRGRVPVARRPRGAARA